MGARGEKRVSEPSKVSKTLSQQITKEGVARPESGPAQKRWLITIITLPDIPWNRNRLQSWELSHHPLPIFTRTDLV